MLMSSDVSEARQTRRRVIPKEACYHQNFPRSLENRKSSTEFGQSCYSGRNIDSKLNGCYKHN